MNLDDAIQAHSEWKVKFRSAIARQTSMDAKTIAHDDCCALGQWLHGDAKSRYAQLPAYRECVTHHAAFHREAGRVAEAINGKQFDRAAAMVDNGTPYATASMAVGAAIVRLKKGIGQ